MAKTEQSKSNIEVRAWPVLALISAMQTVLFVQELPGMSEDFERMARSIEPELADSILLFLLTGMPATLFDLSLRDRTTHLELEPFLDWLSNLSTAELAASALDEKTQQETAQHASVQSAENSQSESPSEWTRAKASESQLVQVQQLLENPAELKSMAVNTLRVFWAECFQPIYVSHDAAVRQIVNDFRAPAVIHDLPSILGEMLGRSIEGAADWSDQHERAVLVPIPFMGPYIVSMHTDEPTTMLILCFDAERAVGLRATICTGPDIAQLKALSDETRLRILRFVGESERFGGEIVTHLGISQPGVSRHLRLLKASGLLRVRQEGTSKFYSSNNRKLDAIADAIRQLKSETKDGQQ